MPRPAARLSNCYVPLPLDATTKTKTTDETTKTTKHHSHHEDGRLNDRKSFELRQLCLETSVFTDSLGSSLLELGHTKVICRVSVVPGEIIDAGTLDCKVQLAPHIGVNPISQRMQLTTPATETTTTSSSSSSAASNNKTLFHSGRLHSQIIMRESYLSKQLQTAIQSSIQLQLFPKCTIMVRVTILQDDGSALSACTSAATLALVDGNIPMYDLVTSCTVAVLQQQQQEQLENDESPNYTFLADPDEKELIKSDSYICLALTSNHKEVTLWTQSGKLSADVANEAIELARNGCRTMHKFMKELWISKSSSSSTTIKQT